MKFLIIMKTFDYFATSNCHKVYQKSEKNPIMMKYHRDTQNVVIEMKGKWMEEEWKYTKEIIHKNIELIWYCINLEIIASLFWKEMLTFEVKETT